MTNDPLAKRETVVETSEILPAAEDSQAALRRRIEEEELAKFQEEQMRAEIRSRLAGQQINTSPAASAPAPAPIIVNVNNTNAATSVATATATVAVQGGVRQHPHVLIRALYFVFFGWWVGLAWIAVAAFLCATIIGLPIGLMMFKYTTESFFL